MFIAQHGSWNRTIPFGYRVMMATVNNGKVVKYEPFAEGWLQDNKKVLGRPVDIEVAKDGSLMISDDQQGAGGNLGLRRNHARGCEQPG